MGVLTAAIGSFLCCWVASGDDVVEQFSCWFGGEVGVLHLYISLKKEDKKTVN